MNGGDTIDDLFVLPVKVAAVAPTFPSEAAIQEGITGLPAWRAGCKNIRRVTCLPTVIGYERLIIILLFPLTLPPHTNTKVSFSNHV